MKISKKFLILVPFLLATNSTHADFIEKKLVEAVRDGSTVKVKAYLFAGADPYAIEKIALDPKIPKKLSLRSAVGLARELKNKNRKLYTEIEQLLHEKDAERESKK